MRLIAIALIAALLAGCGPGFQYAIDNYTGVPVKRFKTKHDEFRVFDKPDENRLMITSSIGKAAGQGIIKGITLGGVSGRTPMTIYEDAALGYLKSTGRTCTIVKRQLVVTPQWEFFYKCRRR